MDLGDGEVGVVVMMIVLLLLCLDAGERDDGRGLAVAKSAAAHTQDVTSLCKSKHRRRQLPLPEYPIN